MNFLKRVQIDILVFIIKVLYKDFGRVCISKEYYGKLLLLEQEKNALRSMVGIKEGEPCPDHHDGFPEYYWKNKYFRLLNKVSNMSIEIERIRQGRNDVLVQNKSIHELS